MHQLSEVWGVHVVQGAAIAVKLRRSGEDAYQIVSAYVEPNDGKTLPVHVASAMLSRAGLRGEPAVVALPDAAEFLATVRVPAGEADRTDAEFADALHKSTHFEPGHAVLRNVRVMRDGDADVFLVAAQPKSAVAAAVHEFEHKAPLPAVAFGGAAVIRGARALGLARDPCVLIEVEPHVTVAYFLDHGHVRRRSVPFGEREILKDAAHVESLVQELQRFADARAAAATGEHAARPPIPFVLVGPGAASNGVRQRLGASLGERLAGGAIGDARVRLAPDGRLHDAPPAALAGAVGAALEVFAPPAERLLVRDLPADLHPQRKRTLMPWFVAAAAVGLVFAVVSEAWRATSADAPPAARGGRDRAVETAAGAEPPGESGVAASAAARPAGVRPKVESIGRGRVRVSWEAGRDGRVLKRHDVAWKDIATLDARAGSLEDEVPGATRLYGWRVDDGEVTFARVEVPVEVEFVDAIAGGGGRFTLRRTWMGRPCAAGVDVAPGEPIRTVARVGEPGVDVVFDSGCWLVATRAGVAVEPTAVRVPRFAADGTVERRPDRSAVLEDRTLDVGRPVVEAEATSGDGVKRTWRRPGT